MPLLYKYFGNDFFLSSQKLKYSFAKEFNDPFELYPSHEPTVMAEFLRKCYKTRYGDRIKKDAEGRGLAPSVVQGIEDSVVTSPAQMAQYKDRFEELRDKFLILCLTRNSTHPLMWAHYANSHKGYCVGFHSAHPLFSGHIDSVEYSNKLFSPVATDPDHLINILFRKSIDWAYEEEIRHVLPFDQIPIDPDTKLHLKTVPNEAIAEISVGFSASLETTERCQKFAMSLGVKCHKIERSVESYALIKTALQS